jgi:hypothetical protein
VAVARYQPWWSSALAGPRDRRISLSFYDRCIRLESDPEFSAGRNDQMMPIYLPYADQFITAEGKGMQEKCLREVAEAAKIPVVVRSYDDLCRSFLNGAIEPQRQ